jgi:hypothetical protein
MSAAAGTASRVCLKGWVNRDRFIELVWVLSNGILLGGGISRPEIGGPACAGGIKYGANYYVIQRSNPY